MDLSSYEQAQGILRHLCTLFIVSILTTSITVVPSRSETVSHVTCGSVIKLENESKTGVRLHSHDIKYGSGSGQQSVTAVENQDTNSYW